MKRTHILTLICVILAGCNAGNDAPESRAVPENGDPAPAPAQQQRAQESPSSDPSAAELVDKFKQAYASGDAAAIEQMVHWEGPADNKEMMLKIVLSSGSGDGTITKAELREPAEDDVKPWATLNPEAILDFTATNKEDSFSKNTSVPLVKVDGEYYFYITAMPAKEE